MGAACARGSNETDVLPTSCPGGSVCWNTAVSANVAATSTAAPNAATGNRMVDLITATTY